jgi:glycosyltransferase involved in cell wall biosynthesis
MSSPAPLFTVFTPTFNRAHTIARVYDSLLAQTCRDFEWLVIDDGSTDGTAGLVRGWIADAKLEIRYFQQPNSGKHVAFNWAVRNARGALFLPLDSDDACMPNALERFKARWSAIPVGERERYSGLTSLCRDRDGNVLGGPLPAEVVDGAPFAVLSQQRRSAETWSLFRTDVLRVFPFPEFPGEKFVPEGLVVSRVGRHYATRFINEALRIYHDSPDSLTKSTVKIRANSPRGAITCYGEAMDLPIRLALRLRAAANLVRFSLPRGGVRLAMPYVRRHPILAAAGLLPGVALAWRDRLYLGR